VEQRAARFSISNGLQLGPRGFRAARLLDERAERLAETLAAER
jgi:hypothetical protein